MPTFITISLLMNFYTRPPLYPWIQAHLCYLSHCYCQGLLLTLPHLSITPISVVTRVVIVATSVPTTTTITTKIGLTIVASIPLLLWLEAKQLAVEQALLWVWTVVLSPVFWVECQVTIVLHLWRHSFTLCTALGQWPATLCPPCCW